MTRHVTTGCRDCRKCTSSSAARAGRGTTKLMLGIMTLGLVNLAMSFRRKCRGCGHQMSLHAAR